MKETVSCLSLTSSVPVILIISFPPRETEPDDGFIKPPRHFRRVDFPDPDGPMTATASPSLILTLRPLSATTFPSKLMLS